MSKDTVKESKSKKTKTKTKTKTRGFKLVSKKHRVYPDVDITLPIRKTKHSAGYDFSTPVAITIVPNGSVLIPSDVKAYMLDDEVLKLYIRSSLGIKLGLQLQNVTGIIDSDYEGNKTNDGNIMFALKNTTDKTIHIKQGDCIAQGIFVKYLTVDNDDTINKKTRDGGVGSTSK